MNAVVHHDFTARCQIDLTRIMRDEGILRICNTDIGFSVALKGNAWGSGKTVGEAYNDALRHRAKLNGEAA